MKDPNDVRNFKLNTQYFISEQNAVAMHSSDVVESGVQLYDLVVAKIKWSKMDTVL